MKHPLLTSLLCALVFAGAGSIDQATAAQPEGSTPTAQCLVKTGPQVSATLGDANALTAETAWHEAASAAVSKACGADDLFPVAKDAKKCKRACNKKCKGAKNKAKCVGTCRRACDE